MTTAIEFQHVQKDFNGQTVIPDLNLMVDQGELFVLVGTSGSGKTTSLKMINRLEPLTAAEVKYCFKCLTCNNFFLSGINSHPFC